MKHQWGEARTTLVVRLAALEVNTSASIGFDGNAEREEPNPALISIHPGDVLTHRQSFPSIIDSQISKLELIVSK